MKKPAGSFAICSVNFSGIKCEEKGTCLREPLSTCEKIFDDKGKSNELMKLYDEISKKYLTGGK